MPRRFSRHSSAAALFILLVAAPAAPLDSHAKKTPPKAKAVTKPTLYVVGYSHLDSQWCWTYPQVIREFLPNTLRENFALLERYPDYIFNWTGSNRYRWMKEYYPEDYMRLKKYVAAGRWFPAGSSVEEGDVNCPSSESIIRQILYGNEFFRDEFGIASDEYMLPDCFGFPASLPSILAHCGIKGFSTQKLTWGSAYRGPGPRQGVPFNVGNWMGPDGQSVVAALNATAYDSDITDDLSQDPAWNRRMNNDDIARDGVPADYRYYGVGDRGGAPHEDSVKNLEKSIHGSGPLHISAGRADQMFNDLSAQQIRQLPTYKGDLELTQHSAGSLTSEAAMKRWNRKNELLGDDTERAALAANWLGALPYDKARITDAWLRFLPGQFHDLMAGTALPLAYNFTWNDEVLAMNEFAGQLQASVGGVARGLDTRGDGAPVIVYNPLSIAREDLVEARVNPDMLADGLGLAQRPSFKGSNPPVEVVGPDGHSVAFQVVERAKSNARIMFLADAPSVGFAIYHVRLTDHPRFRTNPELHVTSNSLENQRYRVRLDVNGDVSSVFDKRVGKELLAGPARLVYMHENPSQFPAWNMDWSDQRQPPRSIVTGPARVEIVENGPVRVALRVTREHEGSKFVQTIRLAEGDARNRVEFKTEIDWHGKETALKAEFPLTASNAMATYDWGIGTVQRATNDPLKYEVPLHGWMDVTNPAKDFGAAILNDCKYGSDKPTDNTLRLTLLYTPGVRGGYQHQGTQDWGHHEMTYALEGHLGNVGIPTQWDSIELNQPLLSFQDAVDNEHPGPLGKTFSLVGLTDNRVQIEALKQAEKSDAIIVRFNELSGVTDRAIHVKFASPVLSAVEVDGQERPIGPATIEGGELVFSTTGYRPHSYAVHIAPIKKPLTPPAGRPIALPFNLDGISMWDRKTYGNFDGAGNTLPGELLPKTILSGGVRFDLGPTGPGQKNVLIPQGQTIPLPNARNKHLSFLMTAVGGDITEADLQDEKRWFRIYARDLHGTYPLWLPVQSWDGYIGQWDNRLWAGKVPELTYDWNNPLAGLQPGFIKRDTVAWYADHRRLADGTNDIYKFCYLYRYDIRLMGDVTSIKLPDDPRLRILAATLSDNPNDDTYPAQPLYDVIDHRENSAPGIGLHSVTGAEVTANQRFDNSVVVTFSRPEYWSDAQSLRYTLDGSQPRPNSPAATGDIYVNRTATIQVAQFDGSRQTSPVAAVHLDILDTTPPAVESAVAVPYDPAVRIKFSKPVDTLGASSPLRYVVNAGGVLPVTAATLSEDGRTVTLSLNKPILAEYAGHITLSLQGIADRSPARNALSASGVPVEMLKPAFVFPGPQAFDGRRGVTQREVPNLPAKAGDAWTLNFFIHPDAAPQDLTILAGFGSGGDDHGAQRYFVVQDNGVEFWGSDIDIPAGQNVDVGKWQMWTASYDGKTLRIYKDGVEQKSQPVVLQDAAATVRLAPPPAWRNGHRFTGQIAALTIWTRALPPAAIAALAATGPPH